MNLIKENGRMICLMVKECTNILLGMSIEATLEMDYIMVKDHMSFRTVAFM